MLARDAEVPSQVLVYGGDAFIEVETDLTGVDDSAVAWGDYDNDGDLDILLTGISLLSQPVSFFPQSNNKQRIYS